MKIKFQSLIGLFLSLLFLFFCSLGGNTSSFFFDVKQLNGEIFIGQEGLPQLQEIALAKTFFISAAAGIDLTAYVRAADSVLGDISDQINITSTPEFNRKTAGSYDVEYNVTNAFGKAAEPLKITVVIWDFVKIVSGFYHSLALTSHGRVYAWGYNAEGQIGDGTYVNSTTPKLIAGLSGIIDIAAGNGCSYALTADGQTYAWGSNDNGRLGDGTLTRKTLPVKVAQPEGVKFVNIACNFGAVGGVTDAGDVYTWGYGAYGATGSGSAADVLRPSKINLTNIKSLSFGRYNGAAVAVDGSLYTWGDNLHGQLGGGVSGVGTNPPAPVKYFANEGIKINSVSAGLYHMTAVSDDGRLYTWGYGTDGRLGNGSTADKNTPQHIALPLPVIKAAAGYFHTGILTSDLSVYFCGQNLYGKHGSGNDAAHHTPFRCDRVSNATDFSLAYDSSFVLSGGSEVYGMGYGGTGVLGTGNNLSSAIPVKWAFVPPPPQ